MVDLTASTPLTRKVELRIGDRYDNPDTMIFPIPFLYSHGAKWSWAPDICKSSLAILNEMGIYPEVL